jgi:hypothetical protein
MTGPIPDSPGVGQQQEPMVAWKSSKEDKEAVNKLAAQMDMARIRDN